MGPSEDRAVPAPQVKRWTILVVEDEPLVRVVTAEILRDAHYKVVEASAANEALMILASDIRIDLVLADVLLPGAIGGLTLAGWLNANRPNVPVILTSGAGGAQRYMEGQDRLPFLQKPYRAGDLLGLISRLLSDTARYRPRQLDEARDPPPNAAWHGRQPPMEAGDGWRIRSDRVLARRRDRQAGALRHHGRVRGCAAGSNRKRPGRLDRALFRPSGRLITY